jgi:hypothetical protein
MGDIEYPGSFNIRDQKGDLEMYIKAMAAPIDSGTFKRQLQKEFARLMIFGDDELFGDINSEIDGFQPHTMYNPQTGEFVQADTEEEHIRLGNEGFIHLEDLKDMKVGVIRSGNPTTD